MSLLSRLRGKRADDRASVRPLWHAVVARSRDPQWYARDGIADTVPGRFDAVALVLSLVLLRMENEPTMREATARLTELFVEDMDGQLREAGIGDLVVGKHVGKLMGVLGGRLGALREALPLGEAAVAQCVARNVTLTPGTSPDAVARATLALSRELDACDESALLAGRF